MYKDPLAATADPNDPPVRRATSLTGRERGVDARWVGAFLAATSGILAMTKGEGPSLGGAIGTAAGVAVTAMALSKDADLSLAMMVGPTLGVAGATAGGALDGYWRQGPTEAKSLCGSGGIGLPSLPVASVETCGRAFIGAAEVFGTLPAELPTFTRAPIAPLNMPARPAALLSPPQNGLAVLPSAISPADRAASDRTVAQYSGMTCAEIGALLEQSFARLDDKA